MLGHHDRHHRQLLDLMARWIARGDALVVDELTTAATAPGPVIDELIDRPRRQQRPALALMPGLSTLPAAGGVLAAPRRRAGRIGAGGLRRVTRRTIGLALKLRDPLVLPGHPRGQPLDLRRQPLVLRRQLQQHADDRLTALFVDRLRLRPLHTEGFDSARLCPPTN